MSRGASYRGKLAQLAAESATTEPSSPNASQASTAPDANGVYCVYISDEYSSRHATIACFWVSPYDHATVHERRLQNNKIHLSIHTHTRHPSTTKRIYIYTHT